MRITFPFRLLLLLLPALLQIKSTAQRAYESFWSPIQWEDEINDWFVAQRMIPYGNVDATAHREAALSLVEQKQIARTTTLPVWQQQGPRNIGGRLTDVEMPASSLQTMYACGASGGVFKSTDAGATWSAIFDGQPSLSIGDLAIAPSNENILYVGTGEPNAGGGSITYDGAGVFKSTDAGATWTSVGITTSRNIGRIAVDPNNPDIVFVAAMGDLFGNSVEQGLFRSQDGGATWQQFLFFNDSTGVIDVAIDPSNTNIVYACSWTRIRRIDRRNYGGPSSGLWKSIDGGTTWNSIGTGNGLPAFDYGRTSIGVSASQPNILYYMVSNQQSVFQGVYKSTDGGMNWTRTNDTNIGDVFNGAAHWEGRIKVDPTDPNIVYLIGFDTWKTADGGQNWSNISGNYHPDNHEVFVHPQQHDLLLLANDGGLFTSDNGGNTWNHNEELPVTQFYVMDVLETGTTTRGGGTQDNGTVITNTGADNDWYSIWGGDGFYTLFDPVSGFTYAEYQYGGVNTGTDGVDPADRFNWNTPLALNPQHTSTVFMGANRLYVSFDSGDNWQAISADLTDHTLFGYPITWGTITTISISPVDTNIIYCGTDDGNVWITTDFGNNWQQVNPMNTIRWVTRVTAHPSDPSVVYCTLSGYRFHDQVAHVYRSNDFGQSWLSIQGNLADIPCNDIVQDPQHDSTLYLATDIGVFVTLDLGQTWNPAGSGMPIVPVTDIRFHDPSRTLFAATYGRSMWALEVDPLFTGISATKDESLLKVYPNPVTDRLFVQSANRVSAITIIAADGRTVYSGAVGQQATAIIDLSSLTHSFSPGCYTVLLATPNGNCSRRFIKQ